MGKYRQVLLHDDVGRDCGVVDDGAALVVVNAQDVRVLGAVRVALQRAALRAAVRRLHRDAPAEVRPCRHFHLARVRQALSSAR